MTTLVVGASGATGRLLVEQLLNRGENVKIIVRSPDSLPENIRKHDNLSVIHASVLISAMPRWCSMSAAVMQSLRVSDTT